MSGYIGNAPVPQATQTRDDFTATSGQTTFATSGYTPGYLDVYLNGVKLATSDYTATNGSDVVLTVGAATGDILSVIAWTAFEATNVDYSNVQNTPTLATVATSGAYSDLSGTPTLATVATTGAYSDLTGSPTAVSSFTNDAGYATTTYVDTAESDAVTTANAYTDSALAGISSDAITEGNTSVEVIDTGSDGRVVFTTEGAEAARIDSSGNLMIGKTAVNVATEGAEVRANGLVNGTRDSGTCAYFNRKTTDGTLVDLRRDNSVYGTIGINSSQVYVAGTGAGLKYGTANLRPTNGSGSTIDATVDLGSSGFRFRHIYSSGNAYINSGYGSSAIAYGCRAWVNFNGTGTVSIRASGNVSSITDNGTAEYTVNFSTAMPDVNYSTTITTGKGSTGTALMTSIHNNVDQTTTTSAFRISTRRTNDGSALDCALVNVNVLR